MSHVFMYACSCALKALYSKLSFQEKNLVVCESPAASARTVFSQYDPEGECILYILEEYLLL